MSATTFHTQRLKTLLIALTVISVVADTMVLPFYPQFFEIAFGITSAEHTGFYIAACCFTVMCAFPLWAKVAQKVHELHLWIYTQLIAAALGVYCYFSTNIVEFWVASQLMLVFKASYLLIYPFVMRLEEKDKHLGVASLFAVLMHFGGIGGAVVGGYVLNWYSAKDLYLIMPASDIIQVAMCAYLIWYLKTPFKAPKTAVAQEQAASKQEKPKHSSTVAQVLQSYVFKLCIVSALFYFSAFLIRPFFTLYWEAISGWQNTFATGLIYSIPAWVALACLWFQARSKKAKADAALSSEEKQHADINAILMASMIGLVGLFTQGSENLTLVIIGRCLFGVAFFQISVRLEVLLFSMSEPSKYASDFSKIHFFQNIGVIASSFSVGYIVSEYSLSLPFYAAFAGIAVSLGVFYWLFGHNVDPANTSSDTKPEHTAIN